MNTLTSLLLAGALAASLGGPAHAQRSDPENPDANATWQQLRTTMFQARTIDTAADTIIAMPRITAQVRGQTIRPSL